MTKNKSESFFHQNTQRNLVVKKRKVLLMMMKRLLLLLLLCFVFGNQFQLGNCVLIEWNIIVVNTSVKHGLNCFFPLNK